MMIGMLINVTSEVKIACSDCTNTASEFSLIFNADVNL